jgi:23S rRNA (guanosine2251-2'-O)-methyltransferase
MKEQNVIVGRKPIMELLRHSPQRLQKVFISSTAKLEDSFLQQLEQTKVEIEYTSIEQLDELSGGVRHQGTLAFVERKQQSSLESIMEKSRISKRPIVCLDEISDPQNVGSIIRSAEAAGVAGIISTSDRSASESSTALAKASAGANEFVDVIRVKNLARTLKTFSKEGFWIYGSALEEASEDFYETEVLQPCVLILGSEGKGLRRQTKSLCDKLIALPMEGVVQSLNVAHAAGIMLYELQRRRRLQNNIKN